MPLELFFVFLARGYGSYAVGKPEATALATIACRHLASFMHAHACIVFMALRKLKRRSSGRFFFSNAIFRKAQRTERTHPLVEAVVAGGRTAVIFVETAFLSLFAWLCRVP